MSINETLIPDVATRQRMVYSDLQSSIIITNNSFTITTDNLGQAVGKLIHSSFNSHPIVITSALVSSDNGKEIVVSGISNILNVPNTRVNAHFYLNESGVPQVQLKYKLLSDKPEPNDWKFSNSFKDLPKIPDWTKTYADTGTVLLDELKLFNAYYVASSEEKIEVEFKVPLKVGINFVSKLHPHGPLAIVKSIFGYNDALTLYGTIEQPKSADITPALPPKTFAWDLKDNIPGILLQADIGLGFEVGNLVFSKTILKMYTPTSQDWLEKNDSHIPWQCYSGKFKIPSADITVDVGIPIELGAESLMILGAFKGLSIAKMTSLADISGSGDLTNQLPAEIQDLGSSLGKIELTHAGIELSMKNRALALSWVSFTIGLPDIQWTLWPDHFDITSLSATFSVTNPLDSKKREFSITIGGTFDIEGIAVKIVAQKSDGYTVYASLGKEQTIPLKELIKTYAPVLPTPSDLTVNSLRVAVAPKKYYSMALAMAGEPNPWTIDLGPKTLTFSDVILNFTKKVNANSTGSFGGTLQLDDVATLKLSYELPSNNFEMRATLPQVTLKGLIGVLSNQTLSLPSSFDLEFKNNYILIQKIVDNYTFLLGTNISDFGALAFQVQEVNKEWGVAVGMNLDQGAIANINGLSALSIFQDVFTLKKLLLVVSSFDSPAFTFPDMANFNNPALTGATIELPEQSRGELVAGLNFYGQWQINTADKQQGLLQKFLGLDPTIGITLQVGKNPAKYSKLFVSYETEIQGHPLSCTLGGQVIDKQVGLFLDGSMTINIQSQPQHFDIKLLFVPSGAFLSATMKGETAIDFGVFKLANLALVVGINWGGVPSLGVAATFDISTFHSSLAVFFNSNDPSKSMVAGAVSDLTLKDVIDTLTGNVIPSDFTEVLKQVAIKGTDSFDISEKLADDLDNLKLDELAAQCQSKGLTIPSSSSEVLLVVNKKGTLWYLTDMTKMRHYMLKKNGNSITVSTSAQFYFAPQDTYIGSIRFPMGFYVNGAIEFFGFNAMAQVLISENKGIAIDAKMDPIIIGTKSLFSITAAKGDGGPQVSVATFEQPQKSKEFQSPHFYINGALEFLGLSKSIFANINSEGILFDIKGDLLPAINFALQGHFYGLSNLGVEGTLKIGIDDIDLGSLGTIPIQTGAQGLLGVGVQEDNIFARLAAMFKFAGKEFKLGMLEL
ncbi:MAG: hypothetical protein JKY09_07815, partial [Crocinitomicaceae bacterium]|nr:hypothetical protein [Crocinitomicaceae bacterium]